MQKDINQVLAENESEIRRLFRRYRVIGEPNMEGVQKGFEKHGENFMLKLLQIITPTEASFTDLLAPKTATLSNGIDTKQLVVKSTETAATSGNFWSFWEKLLNGIGSTGEALGKFKNDVSAAAPTEQVYTPEQQAQQAANTKLLWWVAGGFFLLIVLILIFRK